MGAPQVIWIVLTALALMLTWLGNGLPSTISFKRCALSSVAMSGLLWWGGFFG